MWIEQQCGIHEPHRMSEYVLTLSAGDQLSYKILRQIYSHTATNVSIQARARANPNATRAYVSIAVDVRVYWNVVADEDHLSKARERMSTSGIISIYLNHNHTLSIILYQS